MRELMRAQQQVCGRHGSQFVPSPGEQRVGVALDVRSGIAPINGMRHQPEADITGWYIWAGEELSDDPDFFVPLCVEHLA